MIRWKDRKKIVRLKIKYGFGFRVRGQRSLEVKGRDGVRGLKLGKGLGIREFRDRKSNLDIQ